MSASKRTQSIEAEEEKKFAIKHCFTSLRSLKKKEINLASDAEKHFNIDWHITMSRDCDGVGIFLNCPKIDGNEDYNIETVIVLKVMKKSGQPEIIVKTFTYSPVKNSTGITIESKQVKNYLNNGNLTVEFEVKIMKMTGIKEPPVLKKFDESNMEFSDVVLVVGDQKFYVNKMFLASHSTVFKSLFDGNSNESKQSEVELKDIDPKEFQNYLELIHGESLVNDDTVDGILKLAIMYDSKTAIRRCEKFLLENVKNSQKTSIQKFELANKYRLSNLLEKCLSEIKSTNDIRSIPPQNLD